MSANLEALSVADLGDMLYDYFKEVHGVRPRFVNWKSRKDLTDRIEQLDAYLADLRTTETGRDQLAVVGWFFKD